MIIEWLGHASFLITSKNNTKIITDPYESGSYGGEVGYDSIDLAADVVTVSHSHPDHSFTGSIQGNPRIINKAGQFTVQDIQIKGIAAFHDAQKGKARGENIIFLFKVDGLQIVHLGDLGHDLDEDLKKSIANTDILLIPVGGVFTIGPRQAQSLINSLKPRIVIPMHFKTEKLGFGIETVDSFIRSINHEVREEKSSSLEINKEDLENNTKILILQHSH
jgi:L-ascorbate metabolism protein UlaG (beta-lactamase superfamily)